MKYKRYDKSENYSYTFGTFPTIELIKSNKAKVLAIILSEDILESEALTFVINYANDNNIEIINNSSIVHNLSGKDNTNMIGVFEKYVETLDEKENHLVLVNPSDAGNLGTIIRTLLGFDCGANSIAIINENKGSVDMFNPKVIRASMGAIFSVKIEYFHSFEEYQMRFDRPCYAFCLSGELILQHMKDRPNLFSLVFGNESSGLPEDIIKKCKGIRIEQSNKIDSLNLAISVGVAMYEFSKMQVKYKGVIFL